jgi:hypothetical protein
MEKIGFKEKATIILKINQLIINDPLFLNDKSFKKQITGSSWKLE